MQEDRLIYLQPAENFNEALPIGNGSLGAMVYGNLEVEKLTLNHDTLWSGYPHTYVREGAYDAYRRACQETDNGNLFEAEHIIEEEMTGPFTDSYLPLGTLSMEIGDRDKTNYVRVLDMASGIATAQNKNISIEHLASFDHSCIASRIRFRSPSSAVIRFDSELKHRIYTENGVLTVTGECPSFLSETQEPVYDGNGIRFAVAIKVTTDGSLSAFEEGLFLENAKCAELFLSVYTSYVNHKDISGHSCCARAYQNSLVCAELGYEQLRQTQIAYYAKHYGAVSLYLSDTVHTEDTLTRLTAAEPDLGLVELLFNFGRYLTIASSAKGSQATNLQGIWNEQLRAIWKSNYTVNINTEMNYWHTLMCGLPDFHLPVVELVKKIADTGRVTAKQYYNASGYVCHHNIDLWGNTAPVGGIGAKHIKGNANFSYWSGAAGWLCRNVFEYYEYTLDTQFLRETAYPLMKGAAEFYLSLLRPVGDRLAISPATSPENQYVADGEFHALGKWTTIMQSIVADLLGNCVKACEILKTDWEWKQQLTEIIPKLKPFEIAPDGRLLEWDTEVKERDREHRHVSHLYGLFPADLITTDKTPALAQACRRSLECRGDEGTGWALAWKACLWAKLKDGDHALKMIDRQLKVIDSSHTSCELWGGGTYPNLLCAHPPFQIDGNFGITAAIALLFLQCEDGMLKILPALPAKADHGSIRGLLAKGNVRVDIEWKECQVTKLTLTSPHPQSLTVLVNGKTVAIPLQGNMPYILRFNR